MAAGEIGRPPVAASGMSASYLLGLKLDSIPFSVYHVILIVTLGLVGFVEGYDLALGGSLLVLAKEPLHLTPAHIAWLVVAPTLLVVAGGFTASFLSDLGPNLAVAKEELPPFTALFRRGQLRWTVVGILCAIGATMCYYTSAILLPKALVDQGAAVTLSFGLSSLLFLATVPGKLFTGYLMEVIGRRWTITFCLAGALPSLFMMAVAHLGGDYATVVFAAGALITGFTVLSAFPATRVYLSEQFPTGLRGRGHFFGEAFARLCGGVVAPLYLEAHTASPTVFFGTLLIAVAIGALVPVLFGKETVGQLETL